MQGASESMLIGSPTGPSQTQSPFLPSYLMGDSSSLAQSPASRPWLSPPKSQLNRSLAGANVSANSPAFIGSCTRSESLRSRDGSRFKDRPGAPPVSGLIESVSGPRPSALPSRLQEDLSCSSSFNASCLTPPSHLQRSSAGQQAFGQSFSAVPSPGQIDPFYTQGESIGIDERLDETWVTVFGFPPAATSFILQEFSQYGNILKHVVAADGNWIHIHYQSKLQAKKVLSKNGKVFGGSIMVGVAPCIDKSVMETDKENTSSYLQTSFQSAAVANYDRCNASSASRSKTMRPLTSGMGASSGESEVTEPARLPQRSNSIISKAVEYMFGW